MIALAALLLAASSGQSVADAERAFAALAQTDGQWPAFRATAAPDAILYAPGPMNAEAVLSRLPPPAAPLNWRPARTFTACDGSLAYSTGPWARSDGKTGSFGTLWRHDAAGWRWIYDEGHDGGALAGASAQTVEQQAACPGPIGSVGESHEILGGDPVPLSVLKAGAAADLVEAADGAMPVSLRLAAASGEGASGDRTLRWRINPIVGSATGAHLLRVWSWDGRRYRLVVIDASGTK
jgi:hypothetical protein